MIQVQSVGDKFAWICSLDEDFLGWGCVKIAITKLKSLRAMQYALPSTTTSTARKRSRTHLPTTNQHKVIIQLLLLIIINVGFNDALLFVFIACIAALYVRRWKPCSCTEVVSNLEIEANWIHAQAKYMGNWGWHNVVGRSRRKTTCYPDQYQKQR